MKANWREYNAERREAANRARQPVRGRPQGQAQARGQDQDMGRGRGRGRGPGMEP